MKYKEEHDYVVIRNQVTGVVGTGLNDRTPFEFNISGWNVLCSAKSQKTATKKGKKIVAKINAEEREYEILITQLKIANLEIQRNAIDSEIEELETELGLTDAEIDKIEDEIDAQPKGIEDCIMEIAVLGFLFTALEL